MAHVTVDAILSLVAYAVGGSPSAGPFTIPFTFFANEDIQVFIGNSTTPLASSAYSISGNALDGGFQGGTLTLVSAVSNTTVTINRAIPIKRTTDFPVPGFFNIQDLNTQLDKIIAMLQQLDVADSHAVRVPTTETGPILPPAADRANLVLMANNVGDLIFAGFTPTGFTVSAAMIPVIQAATLALARTAMGVAPINSPTFIGAPAGPSPAAGDHSTRFATTEWVHGEVRAKNWAYNSDFEIYHSNYNATDKTGEGQNVSGNQLVAGRWKGSRFGTAGAFFTRVDVAGLGYGTRYAMRVQRSGGNSSPALIALIQEFPQNDVRKLAGKTVTLSASLKSGASFTGANVSSRIVYAASGNEPSTDGTVTGSGWVSPTFNTQLNAVTGTRTRFSQTVTLPSNITALGFAFYYTPDANPAGGNDFFEIDTPRFEINQVATQYEPPDRALEYIRTGSFYQDMSRDPFTGLGVLNCIADGHVVARSVTAPADGSTIFLNSIIPYEVPMRSNVYNILYNEGGSGGSAHITGHAGSIYNITLNVSGHKSVRNFLAEMSYIVDNPGGLGPRPAMDLHSGYVFAIDGGLASKFAIDGEIV